MSQSYCFFLLAHPLCLIFWCGSWILTTYNSFLGGSFTWAEAEVLQENHTNHREGFSTTKIVWNLTLTLSEGWLLLKNPQGNFFLCPEPVSGQASFLATAVCGAYCHLSLFWKHHLWGCQLYKSIPEVSPRLSLLPPLSWAAAQVKAYIQGISRSTSVPLRLQLS
jgi:hypothetical protein